MKTGQFVCNIAGGALIPRAPVAELRDGDQVIVTVHRPRSVRQLAMYWALLGKVAPSTNYETAERLHVAVKYALGYFDLIQTINGGMEKSPNSIAVESMDQATFNAFLEQVIDLVVTSILPGVSREELRQDVMDMVDNPRGRASSYV